MPYVRGAESPAWLGDAVSYRGLHTWIQKNKPKPERCSHCGEMKPLDWANISGNYTRDLDDWIALCRRCHKAFDRKSICKNGHAWTPENTVVSADGRHRCRACTNARWRRRYHEKKAGH